MLIEIKLYTNKETKKGFPVVLYIRDKNLRKRVNLGWYFKRDEWDFTNEEPLPSVTNYEFIYPKLLNYRYQFKTLLFKNVTDINKYLKVVDIEVADEIELLEKRLSVLKNKSTIGIFAFFDIIIAEKKIKKESVRSYEATKRQIKQFIVQDQPLNNITYEWLNDFILYKKSGGTGVPGINTYLRVLRALYKEAQRRTSLNINRENPFTGLIKNIKVEKPDFDINDLKKLHTYIPKKYTTKKSAEKMQRNIAMCLFQFLIGGHDYIDISNLKWTNIQNNRIKFKRFKNRNKPGGGVTVNNILVSEALIIIKKYGTVNDKRVFSFIPAPASGEKYINYRNNYNRSLAEISNDLNFKNVLKSKSTRYIFRSFAGELLINDLVIMQIQGHKPQGVTFNYQNELPINIIDAAIIKVMNKINIIIV